MILYVHITIIIILFTIGEIIIITLHTIRTHNNMKHEHNHKNNSNSVVAWAQPMLIVKIENECLQIHKILCYQNMRMFTLSMYPK